MEKTKELEAYIDYWVERRAWQLTAKPFNSAPIISFDTFKAYKTGQTSMTMLKEWIWKWPDRFKF